MNNTRILSMAIAIMILLTPRGNCQEARTDVMDNVKNMPIKHFPSILGGTKKEDTGDASMYTDKQELETLVANLRNPFIPQLPRTEAPPQPGEAPQAYETPNPQPSGVEETYLPAPGETPMEIPKPNFKINGLVWNTDLPEAIVDDIVVKIGDYIGQWKVVDIKKEGVNIKFQNVEYLLEP